MWRRFAAAVLLLLLIDGCPRKAAPPSPHDGKSVWGGRPQRPVNDTRSANRLLVSAGATVVSRTGEYGFEQSALNAVDGDLTTLWASPPSDPKQSVTIALAVPARLRSFGVGFPGSPIPPSGTQDFKAEVSEDGQTFRDLTTFTIRSEPATQRVAVAPVLARYLRVTMLRTFAGGPVSAVAELSLDGEDAAEWVRPDLGGSWKINTRKAILRQNGAHLDGVIDYPRQLQLDGGWDGRVARFVWVRGPEWGYAAFAGSPDGENLGGFFWHEKAIAFFLDEPWFGARVAKAGGDAGPPSWAATRFFLTRFGHAPMFGLSYHGDDTLDTVSSAATLKFIASKVGSAASLTSYHFGGATAEEDLAASQRRLDSLHSALTGMGVTLDHVTFKASGRVDPDSVSDTSLQAAIYTRVELASGTGSR